MIFFCERDSDGKIKGLYANRQPGYAEEAIDETHPDVVTYRAPKVPTPVEIGDAFDREVARSPALRGPIAELAAALGVAVQVLHDVIKAKAS